MAKIDYTDVDNYLATLEKLSSPSAVQSISKQAVYKGVEVLANGVRSEIQSHPTHKNPAEGMTSKEKDALLKGLGTASIQDMGQGMSGKIGFDGYDSNSKSKKFPKGVPIPLTARSLLKGTSWRKKDDFMSKTVRKLKNAAVDAMDQELNKAIENKMKG